MSCVQFIESRSSGILRFTVNSDATYAWWTKARKRDATGESWIIIPEIPDEMKSESTRIIDVNIHACTEPQVIAIPSPLPGVYIVERFGTGTGPYAITIESIEADGTVVDSETWTGTATLGETARTHLQLG